MSTSNKENLKEIRRLAGKLQSFLNSIEGRALLNFLEESHDIIMLAASPIEAEGVMKTYLLTHRGLYETTSLRAHSTDTLEQAKALVKHSLQGKKMNARALLEAIASLPEHFDLENIVDQCIHYRAKKLSGKMVPLVIDLESNQ